MQLRIPSDVLDFMRQRDMEIDWSDYTQEEVDTLTSSIREDMRELALEKEIERRQEAAGGDVVDLERGNLEVIPELRRPNVCRLKNSVTSFSHLNEKSSHQIVIFVVLFAESKTE